MNWLVENRLASRVLFIILGLLVLTILGFAATFSMVAPDMFWHLRNGHDLIHLGQSPFFDKFSFTYLNMPVKSVSLIYDVLLAFVYDLNGYAAVAYLRLIFWIVAMVGVAANLKRNIGSELSSLPLWVFSAAYFSLTAVLHSECRPDQFSLALEPFMILVAPKVFERPNLKWLAIAALFIVFWVNVHITALFGYVVLGAFFIERLVQALLAGQRRRVFELVATVLFLFILGFLNHDLSHPLILQGEFSSEWSKYIREFQERSLLTVEPPILIYCLVLAVMLPFLALQKRWSAVVIFLVLDFKVWQMYKIFPHVVMVTLPFLAVAVKDLAAYAIQKKNILLKYFGALTIGGTSLYALAYSINNSMVNPIFELNPNINSIYFPVDVSEYIKANSLTGRYFHEYDIGGFLEFSNAQDFKAYIDGRTNVLYSLEHMKRYYEISENVDAFIEENKRYGFDFIVARTEDADQMFLTTIRSRKFSIEYQGVNTTIFSAKRERFREITLIFLTPQCLRPEGSEKLSAEIADVKNHFAKETQLHQLADVLSDYLSPISRATAFLTPNLDWVKFSVTARLASELAERQKQFKASRFYAFKIPLPNVSDLIRRARIDCDYFNCELTENELAKIAAMPTTEFENYQIYNLLAKAKSAKGGLFQFDEGTLAKIQKRAEKYSSENLPRNLDACE